MYFADYHTHSDCSPDGSLPIKEMVRSAVEKGLQEICITDHVDTYYWSDISKLKDDFDWDRVKAQYDEACKLYGDRISIKLGCELGDAQLSIANADHLLSMAPPLDFIIGSVHLSGSKVNNKDLYYIEKGDAAFYSGVIEDYLDEVETVARWGKSSILGHITLPLRYINENYHEGLTYAGHMDRLAEIFKIIIPKGIGIECNTNRGGEPLPYGEILKLYRDMGGEIITLGSDAHSAEFVGCVIREKQELLRQCGFRYFTTFTRQKPEWRKL